MPPHRQIEQFPPPAVIGELIRYCFALPDVAPRLRVAGEDATYSLRLPAELSAGPPDAFLAPNEFAHLHPLPEGGLHLSLPPAERQLARSKGWAEPHPMTRSGALPPSAVMIYAPRNARELELVCELILSSYSFARTGAGKRGIVSHER